MSLYLGVDAGGTKAEYVLADDSREVARVRGGSIKRMRVEETVAARNLSDALAELAKQAGVELSAVTRTCVGTAGERVSLVTEWLRKEFGTRVGGELVIVGDVEIALDAAFGSEPGVLILAGTGSNVAARTARGVVESAGGWGPLLGDEGSGYRIATEGLRAIFKALDAGRQTALLEQVLSFWNLPGADALVGWVHAQPSPNFPPIAEIVVQCAAAGDAVALDVLRTQGEALGAVVVRLLHRTKFRANEPVSVAFAGSIMEHVAEVREAVMDVVRREYPLAGFRAGVVDPASGALWRARQK